MWSAQALEVEEEDSWREVQDSGENCRFYICWVLLPALSSLDRAGKLHENLSTDKTKSKEK